MYACVTFGLRKREREGGRRLLQHKQQSQLQPNGDAKEKGIEHRMPATCLELSSLLSCRHGSNGNGIHTLVGDVPEVECSVNGLKNTHPSLHHLSDSIIP